MARLRTFPLLLVLATLLGCAHKEEKIAQKYLEKGKYYEKNHQYPQALQLYREIEKKFPETKAARTVADTVDYDVIEQAMSMDRLKNVNDVRESLKQLAKAIESYNFKEDHYPLALDGLVPEYMPGVPRDPWGARFSYGRADDKGTIVEDPLAPASSYVLAWFGRDRIPGGEGDDADVFIRAGKPLEF